MSALPLLMPGSPLPGLQTHKLCKRLRAPLRASGGRSTLASCRPSPPSPLALAQRQPPPPLRVQAPRRDVPAQVIPRRQRLPQRHRHSAHPLGCAVVVYKVLQGLHGAGAATPPRLHLQGQREPGEGPREAGAGGPAVSLRRSIALPSCAAGAWAAALVIRTSVAGLPLPSHLAAAPARRLSGPCAPQSLPASAKCSGEAPPPRQTPAWPHPGGARGRRPRAGRAAGGPEAQCMLQAGNVAGRAAWTAGQAGQARRAQVQQRACPWASTHCLAGSNPPAPDCPPCRSAARASTLAPPWYSLRKSCYGTQRCGPSATGGEQCAACTALHRERRSLPTPRFRRLQAVPPTRARGPLPNARGTRHAAG